MKKILIFCIFSLFSLMILGLSCDSGGDDDDDNGNGDRDYRQDMRLFVQGISSYAKTLNPGFSIIPQNGNELLTVDGEEDGPLATDYCAAIDGVGREDLFFGYDNDNQATPSGETNYMLAFLDRAEQQGIEVLVTDYCWTHDYVDDSYAWNSSRGYISFAADHRELDTIPSYPTSPYHLNSNDVNDLAAARNFLYLINPDGFGSKDAFLASLRNTSYDVLLIDLFYEGIALTAAEVQSLKEKIGGGHRIVIAYMSIGEAEDYRYYWQESWRSNPPSWMAGENSDWPGNYKVRYWDPSWQAIIFGNDSSYCKMVIDARFDGLYLDIIDAFEYFEDL